MTSYNELSGLIDKIAEAAIDWRMYRNGWGRSGEVWIMSGVGGVLECDREGNVTLNGEAEPETSYRTMFQQWRTTTREVLEPWTDLPDPDYVGFGVDTLRRMMDSLLDPADLKAEDIDPKVGGGASFGNDDLHSARQTIDGKLANMQGYAAAEMYMVLVSRTDDVLRGEFAATGVLGQHLAGQQAIIKRARDDVTELFDTLHKVMENKGLVGGDHGLALSVVGALVAVAGSFATGGVATALGRLGASVGLTDALLPKAGDPDKGDLRLAGHDPEESWDLMVEALTKVDRSMSEQERDLSERGTRARDLIAGSPEFDLSKITGRPNADHDGSDPGVIGTAGDIVAIDEGGLKFIAEVSIPIASTSLDRTRSVIEDVDPGYAMTRPAGIGYASDGIYTSWLGLRDALAACIKGTADELWELRGAVIEVLRRFGVTDVEQAQRYQELEPSGTSAYG